MLSGTILNKDALVKSVCSINVSRRSISMPNDIFSEVKETRLDRSGTRSDEKFDFFPASRKYAHVPKFTRQR